jgi:hypothetical protein
MYNNSRKEERKRERGGGIRRNFIEMENQLQFIMIHEMLD